MQAASLIAALQAQNIVSPAGVLRTDEETMALRVSGAFASEQDLAEVTFVIGNRMLRLSDIAEVRRGFADPPQPVFRINGAPAIGLAIAMRDGGDTLALGRNIAQAIAKITADLPAGIEPRLVADQPLTVDLAINEFTTSLWQAIGIVLLVSFVALGVRAGTVVAVTIPLTLAVVFLIDQIEAKRAAGKTVWEAVVAANCSRVRPIMLTALSTVLGMIPIAPTVFWGSMAYAIMGGLLVASLLTLIFLPTLYVTGFRGVPPPRSGI